MFPSKDLWNSIAQEEKTDQKILESTVNFLQKLIIYHTENDGFWARLHRQQKQDLSSHTELTHFLYKLTTSVYPISLSSKRQSCWEKLLEEYPTSTPISLQDKFIHPFIPLLKKKLPNLFVKNIERQFHQITKPLYIHEDSLRSLHKKAEKSHTKLHFKLFNKPSLSQADIEKNLSKLLSVKQWGNVSIDIKDVILFPFLASSERDISEIINNLTIAIPRSKEENSLNTVFLESRDSTYQALLLKIFTNFIQHGTTSLGLSLSLFSSKGFDTLGTICTCLKKYKSSQNEPFPLRLEIITAPESTHPQQDATDMLCVFQALKLLSQKELTQKIALTIVTDDPLFATLAATTRLKSSETLSLTLEQRAGVNEEQMFSLLQNTPFTHSQAYALAYKEDSSALLPYLSDYLRSLSLPDSPLSEIINYAPESKGWEHRRKRLISLTNKKFTSIFSQPSVEDNLLEQESFTLLSPQITHFPLISGEEEIKTPLTGIGRDFTQKGEKIYTFSYVDYDAIPQLLSTAKKAAKIWSGKPFVTRLEIWKKMAVQLDKNASHVIAVMMKDLGVSFPQAEQAYHDAIHNVNLITQLTLKQFKQKKSTSNSSPLALILVNEHDPLRTLFTEIGCALLSGHALIISPEASVAFLTNEVITTFHNAGISAELLQYAPILDNEILQTFVHKTKLVIKNNIVYSSKDFIKLQYGHSLTYYTMGDISSIAISSSISIDDTIFKILKLYKKQLFHTLHPLRTIFMESFLWEHSDFLPKLKKAFEEFLLTAQQRNITLFAPLTHARDEKDLPILTDQESWLMPPCPHLNNPYLWTPGIILSSTPVPISSYDDPLRGLHLIKANDLTEMIDQQSKLSYKSLTFFFTLSSEEQNSEIKNSPAEKNYINEQIEEDSFDETKEVLQEHLNSFPLS